MNMRIIALAVASPAHSPRDLAEVREFLAEHGEALSNAAEFLGGPGWAARTLNLVEEVRRATRLSRHVRGELVALHRLLSLEHVSDPDPSETDRFAAIDLGAQVVEEICLLTDCLAKLLHRIADASEASANDQKTRWRVA